MRLKEYIGGLIHQDHNDMIYFQYLESPSAIWFKGRIVHRLTFIIIFIISMLGSAFGQQHSSQPNIVLIIADDVGWNDLGCYGNSVVRTPNIDRIAAEGIKFTNAFLTTSSCSPSRTSIISGRYPHNTGAAELHTPLPSEVVIFPELLKKAGYYTAQAGKWHMGDAARRGFDQILDSGKMGNSGADQWAESIENLPEGKPFFLWLASLDAHRIWNPDSFRGYHNPDDVHVPPFLIDDQATRQDLALYYDEISRFDYFIGEVEKQLQSKGIANNTIILIMSDNGRPFPRCKTRLYDSGIKTPLIVKWPDGISNRGLECHSLISSIDIAPTILELAGVPSAPGFQGRSFLPLLNHPSRPFRNYVFAEHNWHDHEALERMVRTRDFLYILNLRPQFPNQGPADSNNSASFASLKKMRDSIGLTSAQNEVFMSPRPREELYDCLRDPLQLINLAPDPKLEEKRAELSEVLHLWIEETGDTHPTQITPDWYSRENGDRLDVERKRGEMPGASKHATTILAPGPF